MFLYFFFPCLELNLLIIHVSTSDTLLYNLNWNMNWILRVHDCQCFRSIIWHKISQLQDGETRRRIIEYVLVDLVVRINQFAFFFLMSIFFMETFTCIHFCCFVEKNQESEKSASGQENYGKLLTHFFWGGGVFHLFYQF